MAVDGQSIAGVSAEVSTARIKGRPGTEVELRVVSGRRAASRETSSSSAPTSAVPAVEGEIERADGTRSPTCASATFSEGAHGELAT